MVAIPVTPRLSLFLIMDACTHRESAAISYPALTPPSTLETSRNSPSPEQPRPISVEEWRELGVTGLRLVVLSLPVYLVLEVGCILSTHFILAHH